MINKNDIDFSILTQQDILNAIVHYDNLKTNNQLNIQRLNKKFSLFHNSQEYAHKYLVGIAYGLKTKQEILNSELYNSTGNHKRSAQLCLQNLGFELFANEKFKHYLEKTYNNRNTINTYYNDLIKAIKILQKIPSLETKPISFLFNYVLSNQLDENTFNEAQYKLNLNDSQLYSTLKTKINAYLNCFKDNEIANKDNTDRTMMLNNQPLNQILYGPPGTGKTYNTINKALEIIDGVIPDQREDAKKRFDELVQAKQIEFVTFHQSYGYEEFVEGIKAIPVGEEGNEDGAEMIYKPMSGVFKKLSKLAKDEFSKAQSTTQSTLKKYKLEAKSLNIQAEMIEDNANSFRVLKGSKIRKGQAPSFDQYTYGELKKKVLQHAKLKELDEFYILEEDYSFQSMSAASSIVLGRQSNGIAEWKEIVNDQGLFALSTKKEDIKNYVLIVIDEINRGNISKIFGELITLIEPSKRIGANEALYVKLPYSGESFGAPANLYIIGTMNTADRSIALMDTALRRRFEFKEMMPDTKELEGIEIDGINIAQLLETINKRIEYLYDRDHTIGHAYFTSLKETPTLEALEGIFKNKIIPLLQEYFYDDWEKIQMILGDHPHQKVDKKDKFIVEASQKSRELFGFVHDDIDEQAITYFINENFSKEAYLKLCNAL